ncbi:MAG: DNA polymerase III subunit delta' [Candidatus Aminicenantes bacterium]|nr:MAG: DNA polymerase III subunit delta' [Candidatus Aminicenantes bacterium]
MAFKEILGNSLVKKILKKALQKDKVPNSMLFCGPEGVGKKNMALELAKALNCEKNKTDACEECESCGAINKGNFPDVMVISPEKNVIKIDQMRLVKQLSYLKPMRGKRRVFIVIEAEKMNEEAANSLLKILEEPPFFSYIILITHNLYVILPTIKSRCQVLNFLPISKEDIEKTLLERGYEDEKAKIISLLVRGNLKQALSIEWEEIQMKRTQAWQLFISLLKGEKTALFLRNYTSLARTLVKEELGQILEVLASFLRDFILLKGEGDLRLLMNLDYREEIERAAGLLSLEESLDYLTKVDYAIYGLNNNLNVNLLISSFFSNFIGRDYV